MRPLSYERGGIDVDLPPSNRSEKSGIFSGKPNGLQTPRKQTAIRALFTAWSGLPPVIGPHEASP